MIHEETKLELHIKGRSEAKRYGRTFKWIGWNVSYQCRLGPKTNWFSSSKHKGKGMEDAGIKAAQTGLATRCGITTNQIQMARGYGMVNMDTFGVEFWYHRGKVTALSRKL